MVWENFHARATELEAMEMAAKREWDSMVAQSSVFGAGGVKRERPPQSSSLQGEVVDLTTPESKKKKKREPSSDDSGVFDLVSPGSAADLSATQLWGHNGDADEIESTAPWNGTQP